MLVVTFFFKVFLDFVLQSSNHDTAPIIRVTLGTSVLHLLSSFLSSQWNELAVVLIAHPKVGIYMEKMWNYSSSFGSSILLVITHNN
jgi:hypothetical protein